MAITFASPAADKAAAPETPIVTSGMGNVWPPRRGPPRQKIARIPEYLELVRAEKGDVAAWHAMRQVCRDDLYFLTSEILGYDDVFEPLHDDLCDFLTAADADERDSLALIPRGHFKSTICTISRCIQKMIQDQDVTIGLASGTLKSAKKFLREIRNQLEGNVTLKWLFPDVFFVDPVRESPKWTTEEIVIRRRYSVAKEPTLKAFGIEENLPTGDHYQFIVVDDVVDQEVVSTEAQMQKIKSQLQFLRPLRMTVDQPIHWVGTRYHVRDPYADMLDDPTTSVYLRRAIEDGESIFPTRFKKESLERERVKLGTYHYNSQYMMDPQDSKQMRFDVEWLGRHAYIGPGAPGYAFVCIVDPASRQKKESDFTAITVWAVDHEENFFLVDMVHDKLNPGQRQEAVLELQKKWKFKFCGYETIGFQEADAYWLRRQMIKRKQLFVIYEINNHEAAKDTRILGLQPLLQAGKFSVPDYPVMYTRHFEDPDDGRGQRLDLMDLFIEQYELWPHLKHDDLLDTMQMLIRTAKAPGAPKAVKVATPRSAYRRRKASDDYDVAKN